MNVIARFRVTSATLVLIGLYSWFPYVLLRNYSMTFHNSMVKIPSFYQNNRDSQLLQNSRNWQTKVAAQ